MNTSTHTSRDPWVSGSAVPRAPERPVPSTPRTLQETGLSEDAISDLVLKTLYVGGSRRGDDLADFLCIPFDVLDTLLHSMQQRRFIEVRGAAGQSRSSYIFDVVGDGRERGREALAANQYVGPLPVPLDEYRKWILRQTIRNVHVDREGVQRGFSSMVLEDELIQMLGPAINSAKSLFLFGDPGNGKTLIAECIAQMFGGELYVPYAVDVGGQTMIVYDPVFHKKIETPPDTSSIWKSNDHDFDQRFARVRRPVVIAGGELTMEQLDLQYDSHTKMYQAPFQVKANGGILIIDDFGRQRVPPRDMLNRWIVPLEKRIDYLSAHTGSKFPVPFDCLLIFATNLNPDDLVEEAFLRRIHYKLHVKSPKRPQFEEIFKRVAQAMGVPYSEPAIDFLYREYYGRRAIPPRACHPRDLLEHVCDTARYLGVPPNLDLEVVRMAANAYFLDLADMVNL